MKQTKFQNNAKNTETMKSFSFFSYHKKKIVEEIQTKTLL